MDQIVLTCSLTPFLDDTICPGAVRALALCRALAGHRRTFQTLTCSLARQLGRCTNTVRNYRDQLVEAGYIWWTTNQRTGIATIFIRGAVEPPSRRAALGLEGGAQFVAPIKSRKILPPCTTTVRRQESLPTNKVGLVKPSPQPPQRTIAEQLAAIGHG
jgi:hypothetical protein